ncbi:hypothetical protein SELMODRAFT_443974 [Selaginella moellendorffii]|uniref:DUF1685 domain-containing protein n=2 Tax=Selaginella moellendorffii TaxID=88036 RepID=D8S5Y9_SELML|nr:hypothetical protein SELMODRAFT_443974 [Selaginella moellendorffii]
MVWIRRLWAWRCLAGSRSSMAHLGYGGRARSGSGRHWVLGREPSERVDLGISRTDRSIGRRNSSLREIGELEMIDTPPTSKNSKDHGKEFTDFQWLLAELDRMWFHDNAFSFPLGDWIRSSCCWSWDQCWQSPESLDKKNKRSWIPPEIQSVEMEAVIRPLRETGKVFSTGDLPGAGFKLLKDESLEEDQCGGAISPECVSDGGGVVVLDEEDEFTTRKLETIPSASALFVADEPTIQGLERSESSPAAIAATAASPPNPRRRRRSSQRSKTTRSWSELEFDEVRGLRDLGFKPREGDLMPRRVVSLATSTARSSPRRERIYPSHAWSIRRPDSPLLNLRMPDPNRQGVEDMKAHLKFWARAVASTVRQEC